MGSTSITHDRTTRSGAASAVVGLVVRLPITVETLLAASVAVATTRIQTKQRLLDRLTPIEFSARRESIWAVSL